MNLNVSGQEEVLEVEGVAAGVERTYGDDWEG